MADKNYKLTFDLSDGSKKEVQFTVPQGESVTVKSVSESTADGGNNVVTFSDGKTLTVKNGNDGKTPVKGEDYFTVEDKDEIVSEVLNLIPEDSDEETTLLGTTPFRTTESGNYKLVCDSECNYSVTSDTVVIADILNGLPTRVAVKEVDGHYEIQSDGTATAWYQQYITIPMTGLTVGETYNFIFDAKGLIYAPYEQNITPGHWQLNDANGTLVISRGDFENDGKYVHSFTAPTSVMSLIWYVSANNYFTAGEKDIANVNAMYINRAGTSDLTDVFNISGTFTGSTELEGIPNDVTILAEPVAEVYSVANTDFVFKSEIFNIRQTSVPNYTNQIPLSVDSDGSVYNETGLMADKGLASDGNITDHSGAYVTGFIPVKKGDIIRFYSPHGVEPSVVLALYGSDKATSSGIGKTFTDVLNDSAHYGSMTRDGNTIIWDTSTINYYLWSNFAWLRATVLFTNTIITVNEELTDIIKEQFTLKPTVKVTKDSIEGDVSGKALSGKTVVCFGDSLFGMYRGEDSAPAFVALETGATVHNVGFGGCRMSVHPSTGYSAFCMWALAKAIAENDWTSQDAEASSGSSYFPEQVVLLKSIDFSKVDIVVIHYGTNDFGAGGGTQIDNANDHDDYNTLCGALRYSVEKLLGKYPKLRIYVSLPVYRFWTDNGTTTYAETYTRYNHTLPDFVEAIRSTAAEYNLPVIDSYYGLGINKINAAEFLSDGTHHNAAGRERFGRFIGANLVSQQSAVKSGIDVTAVNALITSAIGNAIGGSY